CGDTNKRSQDSIDNSKTIQFRGRTSQDPTSPIAMGGYPGNRQPPFLTLQLRNCFTVSSNILNSFLQQILNYSHEQTQRFNNGSRYCAPQAIPPPSRSTSCVQQTCCSVAGRQRDCLNC